MTTDRFRVNSPTVASQIIDGEVVMIHFQTGSYFSTDRIGAEIIALVTRRLPVPAIVERLRSRCDAGREDVARAVGEFLDKLRAEDLIVPDGSVPEEGGLDGGPDGLTAPEVPEAEGGRLVFEEPALEKYTDLEDLLLLDPIHDTDAAGWPVVKPEDGARNGAGA
jgi:hypothetical protein